MMGAVAFVLLIACATVANLLLSLALTLVLLVGAGLMVRSFLKVYTAQAGRARADS